MEAVIQISSVESKDVNTKYGVKPVYNIISTDGREFSTFKSDLKTTAGLLRGQLASIEYREVPWAKDDKSGVNLYLDGIKPAEGLTEAPSPTVTTTTITNPAVLVSGNGVSHNITYKDDKSAQINRSVAFKAAVELVGAGVLTIDGVEDLDKLTSKLLPIVDGTYASVGTGEAPFVPAKSNPSSGDAEAISDGILVDF